MDKYDRAQQRLLNRVLPHGTTAGKYARLAALSIVLYRDKSSETGMLDIRKNLVRVENTRHKELLIEEADRYLEDEHKALFHLAF